MDGIDHRVFGRDVDSLVKVGALYDVEPGYLVLGLRVRAVGQQHLTVADANRGGVARRPGAVTRQPDPFAVIICASLVRRTGRQRGMAVRQDPRSEDQPT